MNIRHQLLQRLIITVEVKKLEDLDISWPTHINLKQGQNMRWRHYPFTKPFPGIIFKSLAQELEDIPMFRRHGGYTAFIEGGSLFRKITAEEMGFYDDPYSKFGQLT